MKKLLSIALFMMIANALSAQNYYPQPSLNKFAGTWQYSDSIYNFKIMLKLDTLTLGVIEREVIDGYYEYSKNNIVESAVNLPDKPTIIDGNMEKKADSSNKIYFLFHDIEKEKLGDGYLELLAGKTDEALWTLKNREIIDIGEHRTDRSFSVPVKIILKKVSSSK